MEAAKIPSKLETCFSFFFLLLFIQKRWSQNDWKFLCETPRQTFGERRIFTHLRKCILVQLGPRVNPNSGDSTLVCEMFSFQMNVHHTPFCCAVLPLILDVSRLSTKTAIYDYNWGQKWIIRVVGRVGTLTGCKRWWPSVVWSRWILFCENKNVVGWERMIFVCRVVCVVWRKVADFSTLLTGTLTRLESFAAADTAFRPFFFSHLATKFFPSLHCVGISLHELHNELFHSQCSLHFFSEFPFFMHKAPLFQRVRCEREREIFFEGKKEREIEREF